MSHSNLFIEKHWKVFLTTNIAYEQGGCHELDPKSSWQVQDYWGKSLYFVSTSYRSYGETKEVSS